MRALVAMMTMAAFVSATSAARAGCTDDSECKGERICEKGVCVLPAAKQAAPAAGQVATTTPPASGARVYFKGDKDIVIADGPSGRSEDCKMPCSLVLAPGHYTIRSIEMSKEIDVGTRSETVRVNRGCAGCIVVGITGLVLGGPFIGGGYAMSRGTSQSTAASATVIGIGASLALTGAIFLVVGLTKGFRGIEKDALAEPPALSRGIAATPSGLAYAF